MKLICDVQVKVATRSPHTLLDISQSAKCKVLLVVQSVEVAARGEGRVAGGGVYASA